MNWEEFFKLIAGALFAVCSSVMAYHARDILGELKGLRAALVENAHQTSKLVEKVEQLDKENSSLRRAHDVLTRFLISKGILSPPDPTTLHDS